MIKIIQADSCRVIIKKNHFEAAAWAHNRCVCGIDEVGRGCLAGPLVTAAVILPVNTKSRLIHDSKVLTAQERLKAYQWLVAHGSYGVGIVHHRVIDQRNIWQATLLAMKRALTNLLATSNVSPEAILVDAMPLDVGDTGYQGIPVHHFHHGEQKSISIAAASIIAKVTRDKLMDDFELMFPGYHLGQHKGYGTALHRDALKERQASIIHRESFLGSFIEGAGEDYEGQQTLC